MGHWSLRNTVCRPGMCLTRSSCVKSVPNAKTLKIITIHNSFLKNSRFCHQNISASMNVEFSGMTKWQLGWYWPSWADNWNNFFFFFFTWFTGKVNYWSYRFRNNKYLYKLCQKTKLFYQVSQKKKLFWKLFWNNSMFLSLIYDYHVDIQSCALFNYPPTYSIYRI